MSAARPVIVVTHASFDAARRASVARLLEQLAADPHCIRNVIVVDDPTRKGSLSTWLRAMHTGLYASGDTTHVVWLPDDAIVCEGFGSALTAAIASQPSVVFDCYANHFLAPKLVGQAAWYTTPEGYTGVGGVMPRAALLEHLAWREKHVRLDREVNNDEGVNLWAMATGRLIWKTAESLVDHDDTLPSLDGNAHHAWRKPATFATDARGLDWSAPPVHLGRTYERNHWGLFLKVHPPMPRRAYELAQDIPKVHLEVGEGL